MTGGVDGRGACVFGGGMCGRGHALLGVHVAGGVHGRGHAWWVVCVVEGACMTGEAATAADGMYPTGMHSCC